MNDELETRDGKNLYKVREKRNPQIKEWLDEEEPDTEELRKEIEPWLTALSQSEHLSLLIGSGFSLAACQIAKAQENNNMSKQENNGMSKIAFSDFKHHIDVASEKSAKRSMRGNANIEDQIRTANELIKGLEIYCTNKNNEDDGLIQKISRLKNELQEGLVKFANHILLSEKTIVCSNFKEKTKEVSEYLMNFLISFASRSATRERLNIFTTNYDRIIEYAAEMA